MPGTTAFSVEDDVLENLLVSPKDIAVDIVAGIDPAPTSIVEVGAFQGELLEAFLTRFEHAHGQWTDAGDSTLPVAKRRLARFADRTTFVIGAPGRDMTDGSVPDGIDVLISSWVTAHRGKQGMAEFYRAAHGHTSDRGVLVVLDHARYDDADWEARVQTVRARFQPRPAGPPPHSGEPTITLAEHLDAIGAAGFASVEVVWRSLDSVLLVAQHGAAPDPRRRVRADAS